MLNIFRRNKAPATIPEARSTATVTLEDAQAWQDMFQSWVDDNPGAGVTAEVALTAAPVFCAVMFLSRTMANIPRPVYKVVKKKTVKQKGLATTILNKSPNGEATAFDFWQFMFQGLWTDGAGRAWIERDPRGRPVALWPLEYNRTTVKRVGFKKVYKYADSNGNKEYPAADVLDFTFAYGRDFLSVYSPIKKCRGAIGLYLNLQTYANSFFKNGGVPPLTLEGPMASGSDAVKRSAQDIKLSIEHANKNNESVLPIPTGFKLSPVGFDPSKGQMTDAKKAQTVEIAQAFQIGPAFLQDLSNGKFNNIEQQDLNLVKHLISHFANKAEQEINLKMFGVMKSNAPYCKHNLDALMRGDFKTRIEAIARGINTAQITPNEGRDLEERPAVDNPAADELHIQGATVPLGTVLDKAATPPAPNSDEEKDGS